MTARLSRSIINIYVSSAPETPRGLRKAANTSTPRHRCGLRRHTDDPPPNPILTKRMKILKRDAPRPLTSCFLHKPRDDISTLHELFQYFHICLLRDARNIFSGGEFEK